MKNVLNKQGGVVISNFDMKISPFWFSGPLLNFHDVGYPIIDSKLSQGDCGISKLLESNLLLKIQRSHVQL